MKTDLVDTCCDSDLNYKMGWRVSCVQQQETLSGTIMKTCMAHLGTRRSSVKSDTALLSGG